MTQNQLSEGTLRRRHHNRAAVLSVLSVSFFVMTTVLKALFFNEGYVWLIRLCLGLTAIILVLFLNRYKRIPAKVLPVIIPLSMAIFITISTISQGGDNIHFLVLFACTAIAMIYMDLKGLVIYIFIIDAFTILIMFVLRLPILDGNPPLILQVVHFLIFNLFNITIYIITYFAVNQQRTAEERNNSFEVVLETTPSMMAVLDKKACVESISRSFADWLGIKNRSHAFKRPVLDLFSDLETKLQFQGILEHGGYYEKDDFMIASDENNGKPNWFMLRFSRFTHRDAASFVELHNITRLIEARNRAELAAKAKSDFLANMSHEIRTPMNVIMGMTDLFMLTELTKEQLNRASAIKNASVTLLRIIDEIIDFSKIETQSHSIVNAPFAFSSMMNDVVAITGIKASGANITFTVNASKDIPAFICCDETRLKQVLLNLLNNALKFTPAGKVSLRSSHEEIGGNRLKLLFSIEDSGMGIRPEDIPNLFNKFEQFDQERNRHSGGTGLGLSICQSLVRRMGGDISVESVYGAGSIFSFYIVCEYAEGERLASAPESDGLRVLLYDPDKYCLKSLADMSLDLGIDFFPAGDLETLCLELFSESYSHALIDASAQTFIKDYSGGCRISVMNDVQQRFGYGRTDIPYIDKPIQITSYANFLGNRLNDEHEPIPDEKGIGSFDTVGVTALLVDDIELNRVVGAGILSKFGINVVCAFDGKDAIEKIQRQDFDIVFMDHMMPGIDGIDATKAIRALRGEYATIPIISLSANAVKGMREMYLDAGMDDFISKPIDSRKLYDILLKYLPQNKIIENNKVR